METNRNNYSFEELSKITDEFTKSTLAHDLAYEGHEFTDKNVLKLKDIFGTSVAHIMAKNGYIFDDIDILNIADINGLTVQNIMAINVFSDKNLTDEQKYYYYHQEMLKRQMFNQ